MPLEKLYHSSQGCKIAETFRSHLYIDSLYGNTDRGDRVRQCPPSHE